MGERNDRNTPSRDNQSGGGGKTDECDWAEDPDGRCPESQSAPTRYG